MRCKINDEVYQRINKKVEDGTFTKGNNCSLTKYYFERKTIEDFPVSERTPEVCSSLIDYERCEFSDVPNSSRTREFFISSFTNRDVNDYIKNNIVNFDRQFFKDLIESNEYATNFANNCFAIMPLEYIDEEMCSLAILNTTNWVSDDWFYDVYKRKPEVLTADLWKLGARLYARESGGKNKFLNITPEEYKDTEYYKEMCSCNFNYGMKLDTNKGKIMDSLPQEVLTTEFLLDLLKDDVDNVARFNDQALETLLYYKKDGETIIESIWQFIIGLRGDKIQYMELNDERVEFFLNHYSEDSFEYNCYFKDKYKRYKKEKSDIEALAQIEQEASNHYKNKKILVKKEEKGTKK